MASSGKDNGEGILTSGATLVMGDEGESHHSRDEPSRGDHSQYGLVEYIGTIRKEMRKLELKLEVYLRGLLDPRLPPELRSNNGGGIQGCKLSNKVNPSCEGGSHWQEMPQGRGGGACVISSRVRQGIEGTSNDLMKKEWDTTVVRLEADMAELKKKAIVEFKALDEFQEVVEFKASKYFGEGFDFYKRQISHLHPDLDI
ncbi:hypothetical protein Acr_00g0078020 [Actinidia rufa]|uniref:Uncharacterized protein n=1 Tax=Actinidia rufa TaxID=165716 RepID=A0A7J0DUS0_9ERIC|nr:hypothetical protein Acr_00g0078020 [Actinidia rufa]